MPTAEISNRPATVTVLLSFAAGYVDAVGFVALFGLFTSHVTGNMVVIGAALAHARDGLIAKLLALPVFVIAVALTTLFVHARARAAKPALPGLLVAQVFFLAGFAAAGRAATPVLYADAPLAVFAGLLGVCAMGIQNAASRLLMSELPPTTVMTGAVTEVAIDATYVLGARGEAAAAAARGRLIKFVPAVATFGVGAIAGAVIFVQAGFAALLAPMTALVAVMLLIRRPAGTASTS